MIPLFILAEFNLAPTLSVKVIWRLSSFTGGRRPKLPPSCIISVMIAHLSRTLPTFIKLAEHRFSNQHESIYCCINKINNCLLSAIMSVFYVPHHHLKYILYNFIPDYIRAKYGFTVFCLFDSVQDEVCKTNTFNNWTHHMINKAKHWRRLWDKICNRKS